MLNHYIREISEVIDLNSPSEADQGELKEQAEGTDRNVSGSGGRETVRAMRAF